jgi:hypothetical protein
MGITTCMIMKKDFVALSIVSTITGIVLLGLLVRRSTGLVASIFSVSKASCLIRGLPYCLFVF